ncbi:MAG: hypothetical protein K0S01_614 [Herbinix sp.]|nr:hypothetical protein [Herbinix sp.]
MIKKWGWLPKVILISAVALFTLPWQHKINTNIQGIQSRIGDNAYSEEVSITVVGVYKQFLIKKDTFEGTITIDKYPSTMNASPVRAVFYDGYSDLAYFDTRGSIVSFVSLGGFTCTPDFSKLLIIVSEPIEANTKSWNSKDGLFIAAPAKDHADALKLTKELSKKGGRISHIEWK